MEKSEQPILPSKKTDLHLVDIRNIKIEDGFNVRRDYGDISELKELIRANGLLNPIRCRRKGGDFILIDGHRRHKACMQLFEEDGVEMRVQVVTEGRNVSPEQRVIDMIMLNEGKRLNPLEEAEAISRLLKYGLEEIEISKKIGKSLVYISNLKLLHSAPEKIKVMVRSEQISSTLLLKLMRETSDFDELQDLIHTAFLSVVSVGEDAPVKITNKDIQKSQKKNNSVSALRKALKFAEKKELVVNPDHEELYNFAVSIIEGEYTKEKLLEMFFYEPDLSNESKETSGLKNESFETID